MPFSAGCAVTDLTPDGELPNYNGGTMKLGTEDSGLLCHAVVFSEGDVEAAVVSCDATVMMRDLVLRIREEAERRSGVPARNVLIGATHTHACPATSLTFLSGALPDPVYMDFFVEQTVTAVATAKAQLQPAGLAAGKCLTPPFVFNRRFLRTDGTCTFFPGVGSDRPPAGPVDEEMQFLAFENETGQPIGIVVNYPCHNNCAGGGHYHRDLGGRVGDALREEFGGEFATPFLPAPCGDVAWRDARLPVESDREGLAWKIGRGIAANITAAMSDVPRRSDIRLQIHEDIIDIKDRPLDQSTFCHDKCRGDSPEALAFARRRYDPERQAVAARGETTCPVPIQAISFGDCAIVTNPAELFVEFGLEIKRGSPFPVTIVSELTNGYCGYVPTEAAFQQGGYETHRTLYTSRLAKDGGRQIVEKSVQLLDSVSRRDPQECIR